MKELTQEEVEDVLRHHAKIIGKPISIVPNEMLVPENIRKLLYDKGYETREDVIKLINDRL